MLNEAGIAERIAYGRPVEVDTTARMVAPRPGWALIGRILIAGLFLLSGYMKLAHTDQTAGYMTSVGMPYAHTLALIAGCAEIAGGLSILAGFLTRIGAIGLIVFMIPTTLVFHNFWALEGAEAQMQMVNFLKNLVIIGGLSLLVAYGPGRYSLDARLRRTPLP